MPAGEYLRVAAAQLRRAAVVLKQDADQARVQIGNKEREVASRISGLERQMQQKSSDIASTQNDPTANHLREARMREMQELTKQVEGAKHELDSHRSNMNQEAHYIEERMNQLTQKAVELENMASQF
jgi:chromosome segregation ATPase